jgi:hypothetical protein
MSNMIFSQQDLHRIQRQDWGRLFGRLIRTGREKRGRSVEEVASLAGMEISEWPAMFQRLRRSCIRWPPPLVVLIRRWQPWSASAGMPGESNPALPPPRTFRGTGGRYSQSHMLTSRMRGGESDREKRSIRSQKSEHQYPNGSSQQV